MSASGRAPIGVITGVGLIGGARGLEQIAVGTPYGEPSSPVRTMSLHGRQVVMIARRGDDDELQPHLVPYRANIWALASIGVRILITSTASTGLRDTFPAGTFVVSDQFIDRTTGRPRTFYDDGDSQQVPTAYPFDERLRALAAEVLTERKVRFRDFGTTVVVDGPRFPTAAESRANAENGADLSNMTLMPETALALELGMAVVNISFVTGRESGEQPDHSDMTTMDQMRRRIHQAESTFRGALADLVRRIPDGFSPMSLVPGASVERVLARRPVSDHAEADRPAGSDRHGVEGDAASGPGEATRASPRR